MPALIATCSKADAAAVCGRCKCQRKDWKQHKKMCKSLMLKSKQAAAAALTNSDEKSQETPFFRMVLSEDPILSLISETALDIRSVSLA